LQPVGHPFLLPGGQNANARPPLPASGRFSHQFETRISAIADFAGEGKRKKKALLLSLSTD
jgi:hypothetical protein